MQDGVELNDFALDTYCKRDLCSLLLHWDDLESLDHGRSHSLTRREILVPFS